MRIKEKNLRQFVDRWYFTGFKKAGFSHLEINSPAEGLDLAKDLKKRVPANAKYFLSLKMGEPPYTPNVRELVAGIEKLGYSVKPLQPYSKRKNWFFISK